MEEWDVGGIGRRNQYIDNNYDDHVNQGMWHDIILFGFHTCLLPFSLRIICYDFSLNVFMTSSSCTHLKKRPTHIAGEWLNEVIFTFFSLNCCLKKLITYPFPNVHIISNGETRQNTIQVTRQGLWFILAYMVAMVPAVLTIVVNDLPGSYLIFVACTRPLQGGFNALVYFRPKYIAERQKMVSTSNARNSRLSSILVTLNMPLPRRSSAFSNNGSGQTMSTPQLLDQHVAENKEQHKSSIDLHNSNGDLLSDNENLAWMTKERKSAFHDFWALYYSR